MSVAVDDALLDDVDALEAADQGELLRALAGAGAQLRRAVVTAAESELARVSNAGRPRALVVTGMGGSGIAGDVLAALVGPGAPVPVVVVRGYALPGWVGAADLVLASSYSGTTEETLAAVDDAVRRGCPLLSVTTPGSPLAERTERTRGVVVPVARGHSPRASLWALAVPLLVVADRLGLLTLPPAVLEAAATRLDALAVACRPSSESFRNPGKELALALGGSLPMIWGGSPVATVAAYRFTCQWAENAKAPALAGALPEANHNQVVALDGGWVGQAEDLFADPDRIEPRLRLVLLRDADEHPRVRARAEASRELALDRGVTVREIWSEGDSALERFASLVGLIDYASVYAALGTGVDPTPIAAIDALKSRIAG